MNNKNNLTEAAISNFKDIVSLMESNRTTVEGEVYVGSNPSLTGKIIFHKFSGYFV